MRIQGVKRTTLADLKRGKMQETTSRLICVLHLIGSGDGASFPDQSQSMGKQNQGTPGLLPVTKIDKRMNI